VRERIDADGGTFDHRIHSKRASLACFMPPILQP
jgi:hypothetical protein